MQIQTKELKGGSEGFVQKIPISHFSHVNSCISCTMNNQQPGIIFDSMDSKKPDILTPKQSRLVLFNYLYSEFEKGGHKDFIFVIKNVARELGLSSLQVVGAIVKLRKLGIVKTHVPRRVRDLWKTNFESLESDSTTKEGLENAVIQL